MRTKFMKMTSLRFSWPQNGLHLTVKNWKKSIICLANYWNKVASQHLPTKYRHKLAVDSVPIACRSYHNRIYHGKNHNFRTNLNTAMTDRGFVTLKWKKSTQKLVLTKGLWEKCDVSARGVRKQIGTTSIKIKSEAQTSFTKLNELFSVVTPSHFASFSFLSHFMFFMSSKKYLRNDFALQSFQLLQQSSSYLYFVSIPAPAILRIFPFFLFHPTSRSFPLPKRLLLFFVS